MQFIGDIFIAIIGGYLALTGSLAQGIETLLPTADTRNTAETSTVADTTSDTLKRLDSTYNVTEALPDILRTNAAYQNASIINGTEANEINDTAVEDALVNIFCTYKTEEYTRTNTGTGFFVDPAGIIMTNSHIAQFLLLETVANTGTTTCIVRAGNPATPRYEAELLYISPSWIQQHAHLITQAQPKGTGERDFALLYVTAGLNNTPLPGRFPYLTISTELLNYNMRNRTIAVAGYPAAGKDISDVTTTLEPVVAETTVTELYTFTENHADLIQIGSSPVGAFGASGGPILNQSNEVIGLITTKGDSDPDSTTLRALTLSYINRTIVEESTFTLQETMHGQLAFRAKLFQETIVPFLSKLLESELE